MSAFLGQAVQLTVDDQLTNSVSNKRVSCYLGAWLLLEKPSDSPVLLLETCSLLNHLMILAVLLYLRI